MTHACIDTMNSVLGYFHEACARYVYLDYMDDMSDGEPVMRLICTVTTPNDTVRKVTVDVWRDRVWCKAIDSDGTIYGASIEDHRPFYHGMPLNGLRAEQLMMYLGIEDEWY